MAILFYPERNSWEATDLSQEEKDSLIQIATEVIIGSLGEQLAERILANAFPNRSTPDLDGIAPEDMGQA